MIHNDRERLLFGAGIALLLHGVLFVGLALGGFDFAPYPETSPVFVTLPDYATPEPRATPRVEEPVEPQVDLAEPEPVETQPDATEPRTTTEPRPTPEPGPVQTPPPQRSTPATPSARDQAPAAGRDAPPGSFSTEDLAWLDDSPDRDRQRTSDADLFAIDEPDDADTDLPSWVTEGEFSRQPEATLPADEQAALAEKRDTVPGFASRLAELVSALDNPPSAGPGSADAPGSGPTGPSTTSLPGGSSIDWGEAGSRSPIGTLTLPLLTASDFGGRVPARVSYLIIFDVNAQGQVVPGSLILRQSSGYTLADQKVRAALSTWRFEPAPGTPPVTAIATLHISRDAVR